MTSAVAERKTRRVTAEAVKTRLTDTVGSMIDKLDDLREKKRKHEASIEALGIQATAIEQTLTQTMKEQGLEKASGTKASVSFTSTVVAAVEDWDAVLNFIYETKNGQLVQRRVSEPAYRELRELGFTIPGATDFVKVRLNLRRT